MQDLTKGELARACADVAASLCREVVYLENAGGLTEKQAAALSKIFGYGVQLQAAAGVMPCKGVKL